MIIPLSTHFDGLLSRTLYGHPLQTNTIAIPRGCALVGFNVGLNASDMGFEHELRCFFFPSWMLCWLCWAMVYWSKEPRFKSLWHFGF